MYLYAGILKEYMRPANDVTCQDWPRRATLVPAVTLVQTVSDVHADIFDILLQANRRVVSVCTSNALLTDI